jgi:hypothetical protein
MQPDEWTEIEKAATPLADASMKPCRNHVTAGAEAICFRMRDANGAFVDDKIYRSLANPKTVLRLIATARRARKVEEAARELDDSIRVLKKCELAMGLVDDPTGDIDELNNAAIDVCLQYERLRTAFQEASE